MMRAAVTLQLFLLVVVTLFVVHIGLHVFKVYEQLGMLG